MQYPAQAKEYLTINLGYTDKEQTFSLATGTSIHAPLKVLIKCCRN